MGVVMAVVPVTRGIIASVTETATPEPAMTVPRAAQDGAPYCSLVTFHLESSTRDGGSKPTIHNPNTDIRAMYFGAGDSCHAFSNASRRSSLEQACDNIIFEEERWLGSEPIV